MIVFGENTFTELYPPVIFDFVKEKEGHSKLQGVLLFQVLLSNSINCYN